MPIKIFFCYAHEDERLLNQLKIHLKPLQRQGTIEMWYDRDIDAGAEWEHEIDRHLDTSDIVLLLISPDFMNSDYCYSIEMKRAMERYENGEARVIPIILRHVYWLAVVMMLQLISGKPIHLISRINCRGIQAAFGRSLLVPMAGCLLVVVMIQL
jgi:TIR domain